LPDFPLHLHCGNEHGKATREGDNSGGCVPNTLKPIVVIEEVNGIDEVTPTTKGNEGRKEPCELPNRLDDDLFHIVELGGTIEEVSEGYETKGNGHICKEHPQIGEHHQLNQPIISKAESMGRKLAPCQDI